MATQHNTLSRGDASARLEENRTWREIGSDFSVRNGTVCVNVAQKQPLHEHSRSRSRQSLKSSCRAERCLLKDATRGNHARQTSSGLFRSAVRHDRVAGSLAVSLQPEELRVI